MFRNAFFKKDTKKLAFFLKSFIMVGKIWDFPCLPIFFNHFIMGMHFLISPYLSSFKKHIRKPLHGFTLVELIVVIVILSLLGAIGLVSFSGYSSGARDSTRVEDLTNMQKSLAISATTSVNGKYPLPDNGVSVLSGGVLINTQGYAGKTTLANIKFNGAGLDPLDGQYYTYSTNKTQTGFALMAYLENASNLTLVSYLPSFQRASAATVDYSTRYPAVTGNPIGILLASGTNIPLQASTSTGIELTTNTSPYIAYMAPKVTVTSSVGTTLATAMATAGSGMTSTGTIVTLVTGTCATLPTNAAYYGGLTAYTVSNAPIGTSLTANFSAGVPSSNTCQFNCNGGYSWNGSSCLVSSVSGACTGLPANAVYYGSATSYTLAGAAAGTSLTASYTGGTLIPNSCMFSCGSGYGWNGSSCVTTTVTCAGTNVTQTSHKCQFSYAGASQSLSVS